MAAIKELTAEEEAVNMGCALPLHGQCRRVPHFPPLVHLQDLLQYKDRDRWYLPTFHADDAPDWNAGRFLRSRQLAPGIREVRTGPCQLPALAAQAHHHHIADSAPAAGQPAPVSRAPVLGLAEKRNMHACFSAGWGLGNDMPHVHC